MNYTEEEKKILKELDKKSFDELTKYDWEYICIFQLLSEFFIEKFKDRVNWFWVSSNQKLSEQFIEKFQLVVNWDNIFKYQNISQEFKEKYTHYLRGKQ